MSQQLKTTLQSAINAQIADNITGDISAADVRDNLINMTDSLLFNTGSVQSITGSLIVTEGITGSLQGTATTASFVVTAQTASYVENAVSASHAQTASLAINAQQATSVYTMATTSNVTLYPALVGASFSSYNTLTVDNGGELSYNPSTNTLTVPNIEGTASYAENAQTASYVNPLNQDVIIIGNQTITGSITVSGSNISHVFPVISASLDFVDDAAAASGGVPLGGLYRNGSFIQIRIV